MSEKLCLSCKAMKSREEFHAKPSARDGLQPHCKDCTRVRRQGKEIGGSLDFLDGITDAQLEADGASRLTPDIKAPKRIMHLDGFWMERLTPEATRAEREEFWTQFHRHFNAAGPRDRVALFLFLGFTIPDKLDVMSSPELRRVVIQYSHGYMARGWGQKYAWGTLPALPTHHQQKS